MRVNKELRLEARTALRAMRKRVFLSFFVECFLAALPAALAVFVFSSRLFPDYYKNEKLIFAVLAVCFFVLLLFFRAYNTRLFFEKTGKKRGFSFVLLSAVLELWLFLIKTALFLLCLLPFFAMAVISVKAVVDVAPLSAVAVMGTFAVSLFFLGLVFYRRFSAFLFLVPYYYCNGFSMTQSIRSGIRKSDGNVENLLRLRRSFFGSFLLCVFVFPVVYVWSYYKLSMSIFAERLI